MAKAPVWATLGRLEKRQRNRNIKNSRFYEKKLEKKSGGKIPDFMKNNWRKNLGVPKKKFRKFQILWQKLEKMWGYQKQNWRQICNTQKNANLKCFKYCRQKSANLKCFKYCTPKYCGHKYCPHFWRGMKILSIYPNVGHSKSGFAHSFPRVENDFATSNIVFPEPEILKVSPAV